MKVVNRLTKQFLAILVILFLLQTGSVSADVFKPGTRIVFLGDSVTAAGQFITFLDLQLRVAHGKNAPELINLGLPSEGVTGLSEKPHPFPRPNVHERLVRALEMLKPDVIVACYGINDGIYSPFSDARFEKYKEGIKKLVYEVKSRDIQLVLCTPIAFDAQPFRIQGKLLPLDTDKDFAWFSIYEGYEGVMAKYAEFVKAMRDEVDVLVNVYDPLQYTLRAIRKTKKDYSMSSDGVHVNNSGHMVIAKAIASATGTRWYGNVTGVFGVLDQRTKILHDSYLSYVGHKRPGTGEGLSVAEAEKQAQQIMLKLDPRLEVAVKNLQMPGKGAMARIDADPDLPNVLLLGDSISIGYTLGVRANLKEIANVHRPATNCGPSVKAMAELDNWLGTTKWDVIHFNFGLHDLKWMGPNGENLAMPKGEGNTQQVPLDEYVMYLDSIAQRLKATGAVVIFRNTTPVPQGAKGRVVGDSKIYNQAAAKVMKRHNIAIDDMYGYTIERLATIMLPANVHFNKEGNVYLAEKVSAVIKKVLDSK